MYKQFITNISLEVYMFHTSVEIKILISKKYVFSKYTYNSNAYRI
jgi:hypothetical protein